MNANDRHMTNQTDALLTHYRMMQLIRAVETTLVKLFADGEVPGFIHLSIGQEAVASGVVTALEPRDSFATTHRGHGHVVARGIDLEQFFKELMGKADGMCGGRGGSMHVADVAAGVLGANGIVGAGIPIALGSAMAHQVRGTGGVAVAFFGDGAMAEGVLHESLNLASLWKLPMLFVCENNGWSEFSPTSRQFIAKLGDLARAFGTGYEQVDGNDVAAVADAAQRLIAAARCAGPQVLECVTTRVRGHFEGDPQKYRPQDELGAAGGLDPIQRAAECLCHAGVTAADLERVRSECEQQVARAVATARAEADPDFARALADVYTTTTVAGV